MSYHYGTKSQARLDTVHVSLQDIFSKAIDDVDITILCGRRDRDAQNYLYDTGASKVEWPHSKHNVKNAMDPAAAIDFAPYPIDWNDIERFRAIAFFLRGIAASQRIQVRLGADWDGDFSFRDQSFHDVGHIELVR